jgi:hypothetical protein
VAPYLDTRQHPPFVSISGPGIVAEGTVKHGRAAFTAASTAAFTAWRATTCHLCKCNQALDDHLLRGLMRFIEMTSRKYIEDVIPNRGVPITNVDGITLKGSLISFIF